MNANSTAVAVNMSDVPHAQSASVDTKAALERELMQRVLAGETNLFYDLIRPYERAVFLAATSILRNEADGEEVAQEAMVTSATRACSPGTSMSDNRFPSREWPIRTAQFASATIQKHRRSIRTAKLTISTTCTSSMAASSPPARQ